MTESNAPETRYELDALHAPTPRRRWLRTAALTLLLMLAFCAATLAVGRNKAEVQRNLFHTGSIKIDLNHGQALFRQDEFLLEPGMTLEKPFTLTNNGTWDVYYKFYFSDVSGPLADVVEVTVRDDDTVLYSGLLSALTRTAAAADGKTLAPGQTREFTATFYLPPQTGNAAQGTTLCFALYADAVQTKNNPDALFD